MSGLQDKATQAAPPPPPPPTSNRLWGAPWQSLRDSGARQDRFTDSFPRVAAVAMATARSNKSTPLPPGLARPAEATAAEEQRERRAAAGFQRCQPSRRVPAARPRPALALAAPPPAGPRVSPGTPAAGARPRGPHPPPPALGLGCAPRRSNGARGTSAGAGAEGLGGGQGSGKLLPPPSPPPPAFSLSTRVKLLLWRKLKPGRFQPECYLLSFGEQAGHWGVRRRGGKRQGIWRSGTNRT